MKYLLDSGILVRLVHDADPQHQEVVDALAVLKAGKHTFYAGAQNIAEFWNVFTRPTTARGGFGMTPLQVEQHLIVVERAVDILTESPASYAEWKRLVIKHGVSGVQVHDTRLVALMTVEGIDHLLTFNSVDFGRFAGIVVKTPSEVLSKVKPSFPTARKS